MYGLQRSLLFTQTRTARRAPAGYQRPLHTSNVRLSKAPMWKSQDSVPRFPVPPLNDTLDKFLEVLKPLLTPEEHAGYAKKVETFRQNQGPFLQSKLEELDKDAANNWVEGFWSSMYLKIRDSQTIFVSPFLLFGDDPSPIRNKSQILKAASFVAAGARLAKKIVNEELEPEMAGPSTPLCVYQYTQLLGVVREPQVGRDKFVVHGAHARHVAVICENQFFELEAVKADGSFASEKELAIQLTAIQKHAISQRGTHAHLFPVGILSAGNRDVWAKAKQQLRDLSETNRESFDSIDKALFVVCLDNLTPKDLGELCTMGLHGTPGQQGNRYYDKHMFYFTRGGSAGCILEHTSVDGLTMYRMLRETYTDMISTPVLKEEEIAAAAVHSEVKALPFETNASIRGTIAEAEAGLKELISVTDLAAFEFSDFGKAKIKSYKVSPDAFFQAALHIATKRTLGRLVSTYESSSVAHFKHGRTETIRSLTEEMKAFVLAFEDPSVSHQTKLDAFRKAASRHSEVAKDSKSGKGQDRHLQGLYWTSQQVFERLHDWEIPSLFDSTYWEAMSNRLSTSNVGGGFAGVRLFGFGAVHMEGLGVGYMINDDSLPGTVTSYTGKAKIMADNVVIALRELSQLCESK